MNKENPLNGNEQKTDNNSYRNGRGSEEKEKERDDDMIKPSKGNLIFCF
jgi:hypothetical protein